MTRKRKSVRGKVKSRSAAGGKQFKVARFVTAAGKPRKPPPTVAPPNNDRSEA